MTCLHLRNCKLSHHLILPTLVNCKKIKPSKLFHLSSSLSNWTTRHTKTNKYEKKAFHNVKYLPVYASVPPPTSRSLASSCFHSSDCRSLSCQERVTSSISRSFSRSRSRRLVISSMHAAVTSSLSDRPEARKRSISALNSVQKHNSAINNPGWNKEVIVLSRTQTPPQTLGKELTFDPKVWSRL